MARQSLPDAEVPDPGRINSQQDFGRELTLARQQAGLTIRDVAKTSGIPVSTVGDYFAARHLPPARQPELLPSILAVCQITEPGQVAHWLDALNRVRRAPGRPPAGPAPYRGLASFQPEDAAWFFGREELALHLVRLADRARLLGRIRPERRSLAAADSSGLVWLWDTEAAATARAVCAMAGQPLTRTEWSAYVPGQH